MDNKPASCEECEFHEDGKCYARRGIVYGADFGHKNCSYAKEGDYNTCEQARRGDGMTINTLTSEEFYAWRTGCDPLYIDVCGDRVFVHIEPDADISAAYEAIQHVFERLLSFEGADA